MGIYCEINYSLIIVIVGIFFALIFTFLMIFLLILIICFGCIFHLLKKNFYLDKKKKSELDEILLNYPSNNKDDFDYFKISEKDFKIEFKDIKIIKEIGQGASALVFKVINLKLKNFPKIKF
jgi:hypothetical protein